MDLRVKRAYDPAEPSDGYRVLIDRLWPRGVSHERAKFDQWERELSPSTELRRWFGTSRAASRSFAAATEMLTLLPFTPTTFATTRTMMSSSSHARSRSSRCACTMLPFLGVAHVAYPPGARRADPRSVEARARGRALRP